MQQTLKPILERIKNECGGTSEPEPPKTGKGGGKKGADVDDDKPEPPPHKNSFARDKKNQDDAPKSPKPQLKKKQVDEDDGLSINPTNKRKRE